MGKLARLVGGIKAKLSKKKDDEVAAAAGACYDKVEKTDSMRVEIRSRRARELIAKNLTAADTAADTAAERGAKKSKKRFFAF